MLRKALGALAALAVLSAITVAIAQSRRVQQPAVEQATRALLEGRYDQVAGLLEKLDAQDPTVSALVARADIARGRYQQAETRLRPVAQRVPTSEAALQLGLLLKMLGRADAQPMLARVAAIANASTDATEVARGARALRALARFQESKSAYVDAETAAPRDPAIHTALGELFLEKYNKPEALKSFQSAVKIDSKWTPALLGAAQTLADEDPQQAIAIAKAALDVNPSDVGVHVFLAREAAGAGRLDDARASLQKALEVNPSSLEARALSGALAYIQDKTAEFDSEVAKALALNPTYGEVYRVAAELTAIKYRFDEAVALVRRGLALDPRSSQSLSDLGVYLLRTGDEPAAREALERSLDLDPFDDILRKNLLSMMDTLDKYATVRDRDIVFRMHKEEVAVMQEPALALAHRALDTLAKKYQFTPRGPILIEMFSKHDDFAVRTLGLPGMVGALGACFGRVVTLDSPRARPPGDFQWEATLWHELAHVITLQMSNQRLPRWLSEGVSTYEEKLERPDWARPQDMQFAGMLNRKEVLKLKDLEGGFSDGRTISMAYFQAGVLAEHIVATFGDAGLHKLIRAYGQGHDTPAALKSALDTDLDALQAGFDKTVDRLFGKLRTALEPPAEGTNLSKMPLDQLKTYASSRQGNYIAQIALGDALRKAGDLDAAVQAFERASAAAPMASGDESPQAKIAEIALEKKDTARAITALQALMGADFDNVEVARQVALLMRQSGITDPEKLRPVYQRVVAIDPFDAEAHTMLGRVFMQLNQPAAASRSFKTVVALKPLDPALAHTELAESYFRSGNRAEARRQTLAALEVAPSYERAQDLLLKLAEGRP
jgi:tetratricopeptide (TPR) repeat protein